MNLLKSALVLMLKLNILIFSFLFFSCYTFKKSEKISFKDSISVAEKITLESSKLHKQNITIYIDDFKIEKDSIISQSKKKITVINNDTLSESNIIDKRKKNKRTSDFSNKTTKEVNDSPKNKKIIILIFFSLLVFFIYIIKKNNFI